MKETLVDFLRHGEPVGGRRYRGDGVDDPLSEKGWQQMWDAVGEHHPWDRIVASPLSRCLAFAEALAARHGIALSADPRFMEVGFGSWEGNTAAELEVEDPDQLRRFYADPVNARPAGAEVLADFFGRVSAAVDHVLDQHAGKHVLVVAHAGVIRAAIAHVIGAPAAGMYRIQVDNAGITRIRSDGVRPPTLLFHGGLLG